MNGRRSTALLSTLLALLALALVAGACGDSQPPVDTTGGGADAGGAGDAAPGGPDGAAGSDALASDAGGDAASGASDSGASTDGGAVADATSAAMQQAIDKAAAALLAQQRLVGLGVGVVVGGQTIYLGGYGQADRAANRAVDPRKTLFRWASISKTITGTLAVRLARAGKLSLDARISTLLPGYKAPTTYVDKCNGQTSRVVDGKTYSCVGGYFELPLSASEQRITLRQLLGNIGGIMHYSNGKGSPSPPVIDAKDPKVNTGVAWALKYLVDKPLVAKPGTRYSYSTFGFNLAGAAIEAGAGGGKTFADLVAREIAAPAGMTTLQPDYEWVGNAARAVGYVLVGNTPQPQGSTDVSWKLPGGGFMSTVQDLARFCRALAGDALLDAADKTTAWTALKVKSGASTGYALGIDPGSRNGRRYVQHSGSQEKTRTRMRLYTADKLCIVVMSNSTHADTYAAVRAIEDAVRPLLP